MVSKKKSEISVAKRQGKDTEGGSSGSSKLKSKHAPKSQAAEPAPKAGSSNANDKVETRKGSGVEPRKVSDSIQQLDTTAMRLVRDSYNLLDSDGSGSVSKQALKDMMRSLGQQPDEDAIDQMMKDAGGEDSFGFANYLVLMSKLVKDLPAADELTTMFSAFEKDGVLDVNSLRTSLEPYGISTQELDAVLKKFPKRSGMNRSFDAKAYSAVMGI